MTLHGKKVAIFGMGTSGVSAFKLASFLKAEVYAVSQGDVTSWNCLNEIDSLGDKSNFYNQNNEKVSSIFSSMDLIILSPGIAREHDLLKKALVSGVEVICEIELAYRVVKADRTPIISVTGTNGKTTTVTLLGEIFTKAGHKTFIGGNIGVAFCDYALERLRSDRASDILILELSSFQLESLVEFKSDVAAILNIFPNHGERYESVDGYALAKWNIIDTMSSDDSLIVSSQCLLSAHKNFSAQHIINEEQLCFSDVDVSSFKLIGHHNKINLSFAILMAKKVEEKFSLALNNLVETISSFSGVSHRLQYLESDDSFTIYNDAKSTNWDATITALKSFDDVQLKKPVCLILGGKKRGRGDSILPFSKDIKNRVSKIFLIGETTDDLSDELEQLSISFEKSFSIENALKKIRSEKFDGYLVFSPAFPSFDQYQNYVERGEAFIKIATQL